MIAAPKQYIYETVKEKDKGIERRISSRRGINSKQKAQLLVLVFLAFIIGMSFTYLKVQLMIAGYKVEDIKEDIRTLQRENENLQLEVARLKSPERIAMEAASRLDMVEAQTNQICYVPGNSTNDLTQGSETLQVASVEQNSKITTSTEDKKSLLSSITQVLYQWLEPTSTDKLEG
ncbi:MAG: hypothetical protein PWP31_637 [Clostridia bacterium]|nr:hypothetical protein [Clostridia bacterium]